MYVWIITFAGIGVLSLVAFIYFLVGDNELKTALGKASTTLFVNWCLFLLMLVSFAMAIILYLNMLAQLNYQIAI